MKGSIMKRLNNMMLIFIVMILFCDAIQAKKHEGFIAGACALGAALFGIAGAVAFADWNSSETDDQFIERIKSEYQHIHSQYYDTMTYFGKTSGLHNYISASYKPFHTVSELALYEFATYVWHQNSTQYNYRSNLIIAKNRLQSGAQELRKRIRKLEGKFTYEDQQNVRYMRILLNDLEEFLSSMMLFADCLEHHKTYFNLYDSVDAARARYIQELTIFESGRYSVPAEIKFYIINNDSSPYAFKNFVQKIEEDITVLKSNIRVLAYNYPKGKAYAKGLVNMLVEIRNIILADPRHQEELYQWEQAHNRFEQEKMEKSCGYY
jgi:hypothetical protein